MSPWWSARASTGGYRRTGDGTHAGVHRREADCRELAHRRGWPVADVYVDDDISAYSGRARHEYRRMLDDITEGRIDAVIVWHLDRLHRHPGELEEFLEVCDRARLTALATVTGDVDLATHDGQLMARIMGAVARQSDDKSRANPAQEGGAGPRRQAFGWWSAPVRLRGRPADRAPRRGQGLDRKSSTRPPPSPRV